MAMTLRLTEEQERALALLAEADGVSKHEAAVRDHRPRRPAGQGGSGPRALA
jgi:hypothetical protein